jgi:hypothetical protein
MRTNTISSLAAYAVLISIWTGCILSGNVEAAEPGVTMRVLWTVSGYVFGKASTMADQEAKALLFKPLDINETGIIFNNGECKGVTFRRETVDAAQYLADVWQITPQTLGIDAQKMQVIRTNCDIPGFQEYMRLSDRRLIVPIKGVFFFFEPAVTQ